MGSCRPALCRSSARRSFVRERAAGSRSRYHGAARRRSSCVDIWNRQRFYCEADRCLSAGRAEKRLECRRRSEAGPVCAIARRLRTSHRDGGAAWSLSRKLRKAPRAQGESANRVEYLATRSRSRFSQGTSHHGADPVHVVSGDRSQSAEVCAEHLQSYGFGLCLGHAANLLLGRVTLALGALSDALSRRKSNGPGKNPGPRELST